MSVGAQATPGLTPTPEQGAENFVGAYNKAESPRRALQDLFGIEPEQMHGDELLQLIEKNGHQYSSSLDGCAANLKSLGGAAKTYGADHGGSYPSSLKELSPTYLKAVPPCPAAGVDTYSSSYRASSSPARFSLHCSGNHHQKVGVASNQPSFSSDTGLQGKPLLDKPSSRSCKVTGVSIYPNGLEAIATLEETLTADLDKAPLVGEVYLHLIKTEAGWWVDGFELSKPQQDNVQSLLDGLTLARLGLSMSGRHFEHLDHGDGNLLDMTPLQQMVVIWEANSSPVLSALEGLEPRSEELIERVKELRYLAKLIEKHREQQGAWPDSPQTLFGPGSGADTATVKSMSFRPSADGQQLELVWPNEGFAFYAIPSGYPTLLLRQGHPAKVIYRPSGFQPPR
jgi:hypothetical protein